MGASHSPVLMWPEQGMQLELKANVDVEAMFKEQVCQF